jgi:tyrosine-protein kinase Etk/Wzc
MADDRKQSGTSAPGPIGAQGRDSSLHEYLAILQRGRRVVLGIAAAVFVATALYTFLLKPVYESTALVLVDSKGKAGTLPFLDFAGGTGTKIINELETLKSYSLADGVARALVAQARLDDEARTPIEIIQPEEDGAGQPAPPPGTIIERLKRSVEFSPVRESDIIRITARSANPIEAALVANTYARVYSERNLAQSRVKSRAVREFLQTQLQTRHSVLDSTERALQGYMQVSGMVSLDMEADKVVKQLSDLEAARDGLEVEITSGQKTLASYKQELANQEPHVARAIGESNDAYIRLLQDQLARLEVQRDVVIAQNPELQGQKIYSQKLSEIDAQIATLKKTLQQRTDVYLQSVIPGSNAGSPGQPGTTAFLAEVKQKIIEQQIALDGLNARKAAIAAVIAEYEKQFNQIPEKSMELARLQRARLSSEKLYLLVQEKFNEAAITETSEMGYITIMDPAIVPVRPVSPKKAQNLVLGLLMGLFLGIGVVLIRARLDTTVSTPEDLKKAGFVPLSTISLMPGPGGSGPPAEGTQAGSRTLEPTLIAHHNPFSPIAESFRHLRTNVQYAQLDRPLRNILITSSNPQEGKTTTAANLAITFAQMEQKVLLVDADMRKPQVHHMFGAQREPGLTDYLIGRANLEGVVDKNVLENLDIVYCGKIPPNPAEVLGSKAMREFIRGMGKTYDVVLFDSPPLLAVTDAAVLAAEVDAVILVASAGRTDVGVIERSAEILRGIGRVAMGVVLNNFDLRKAYVGDRNKYGGYGYYRPSNGQQERRRKRRLSV